MTSGPDRLVWRVRHTMQADEAAGGSESLSFKDAEELARRLRRLHERSDRYGHVRLSGYVVRRLPFHDSMRGGDVVVATEA